MSAGTLPIVLARMSGVRLSADSVRGERAVACASPTAQSMNALTKHVISLNRGRERETGLKDTAARSDGGSEEECANSHMM